MFLEVKERPLYVPTWTPTWRDILLGAADRVERGWTRGALDGNRVCPGLAILAEFDKANFGIDEFYRTHSAVYAALKRTIGVGSILELGRWNRWQWSGKTVANALRKAAKEGEK